MKINYSQNPTLKVYLKLLKNIATNERAACVLILNINNWATLLKK